MLNRRKATALILFTLYALIVFVPPVYHGYIYPNGGDDTGLHLTILKSGDLWKQIYLAYVFVGYPIRLVNALTGISINALFFWFNYLTLFMVGVTNYFVAKGIAGYKAGLVALFTVTFLTQGIMYQFDFGQIFNIINMGIIFPCLIYFAVKWYAERKRSQLIALIGLDLIMSVFHSTGIYLAPLALVLVGVYIVYAWVARKEVRMEISYFGALAPINFLAQYFTMNRFTADVVQMGLEKGKDLPLWFIGKIISPFALILIGLAFMLKHKKHNTEIRVATVIIGAFALMLTMVIALKLSFVPDRQLYDVVTPIGLLAAILAGRLRRKEFSLIVILVGITVVSGLPNWFTFHNAVREPDKQAFSYLDTLKLGTFCVTSEVTPNIYWNYVKHGYVEQSGDYLVVRNYPQTACSDPDSQAYVPHGANTDNYVMLKSFAEDGIEVGVYRRE